MKKIYTLIAAVAVSMGAFAQYDYYQSGTVEMPHVIPGLEDRSDDTLGTASFLTNCGAPSYSVYSLAAPGSGYIFGTNTAGAQSSGNFYTFSGNADIVGAYVWFAGYDDTPAGTSTLQAAVLNTSLAAVGTSSTSAPGDIDTTIAGANGWHEFTFASAVTVTEDFYIMVSHAGPDTCGIVSTADGCGTAARVDWGTGVVDPTTVLTGFSGVDLGILVLVNNLAITGLFDETADNFGMFINENQLMLNAFNKEEVLEGVTVYDLNGKAVASFENLPMQDNYVFDLPSLQTGTYVVALNTDRGNFSQKVFVK